MSPRGVVDVEKTTRPSGCVVLHADAPMTTSCIGRFVFGANVADEGDTQVSDAAGRQELEESTAGAHNGCTGALARYPGAQVLRIS
jgi:hypothetical protein